MNDDQSTLDDRAIDDLLTASDREAERWRIEAYAGRQREKWPPDANPRPPGYQRRSAKDWFKIGEGLASLQGRMDAETYPFEDRGLRFRALLLIWPVVMPYTPEKRRKMTRRQVERSRDRFEAKLGWPSLALSMMWGKEAPAYRGSFDPPRITLRRRTKLERFSSSNTEATEWNREAEDEIIGRAVMAEYLRHPKELRTLESAWTIVADQSSIDGIKTGKVRNVEARYHRYRRLAEDRGYADSRAFQAEYHGEAWPADQIWLSDFPSK